jgi:NAD(P)-dependent dehydrogenase (short-subunit alcohol dehydrogenase family)
MRGQVAVVTGANRGLGLELCRQLKHAGTEVIGTARDPQTAVDLRALEVRVEELDVAQADSVGSFAERLGDTKVDLLINNAGVGGAGEGIANLDFDDVEQKLQINTLGAMRVTQALLPNLRRGKGRKIAHLTSRMGSIGDNGEGGYYAYRISKAALNMFNRSLAVELVGQGFVCVVLHPGWVRTRMGGSTAPQTPEESARAMLELIARLRRQDTGRFFDYTGAELRW